MKKKIIIAVSVLVALAILVLIIVNVTNKSNEKKLDNLELKEETFTITDNGTEIDVSIKNNNKEEISIESIEAVIYDDQNKEIGKITQKEKTEIGKNKKIVIKLVGDKKYPSAASIKFTVN